MHKTLSPICVYVLQVVFSFLKGISGCISLLSSSCNVCHELYLPRLDLADNIWWILDDNGIGKKATGERKNSVLYYIDVCTESREEYVFIAYLRK
jgi:hypothetical protein